MPKHVRRTKTSFIAATLGAMVLAGMAANAGAVVAPKAISHIHVMPTVDAFGGSHAEDCGLVVVEPPGCLGVGQPMFTSNGPIQSSPGVYIVRWGWTSDPAGQAVVQENFFKGIGGTTWGASQTQYCRGTTDILGYSCSSATEFSGNQANVLKGVWADNTNPIPASPTDSQIIAEAVRAAAHFGNTTSASNAQAQYVISTPPGKSTSGFKTSWCAYHGMAGSTYGNLAYTDFPYVSEAGSGCGANAVNSGTAGKLDGVSIVAGHEYSETATDVNPPTAWTDITGAENADKCAWIFDGPGAMTNVTLSTGTFAVQSLWSNNANSGAGGCVTYYAGPNDQH